jgi:3-hydroxyacyl-CoA dehydrogenase
LSEVPTKVALVGTGLIGRGWAAVFARAGSEVVLWDAAPGAAERAVRLAGEALSDLAEIGLATDPAAAASRLRATDDLAEALAGASYVQESVTEDRAVKAALFAELDRLAPGEAVLGSSTSAISGSAFLADVPGRARCIVAHPANPPHLMPVVELVPAPFTAPETTARAKALMAAVGQVPVVLHAEIEGFVMNRLQSAVVNEAMALVARGIVDPDDLDAVMKHSIGLRWSFMGPFETMDLNAPAGFLDYATRYGSSYERMGRDLTMAAPWQRAAMERIEAVRRQVAPIEAVPARQRWRDRRLMRLLRERARSDDELGR